MALRFRQILARRGMFQLPDDVYERLALNRVLLEEDKARLLEQRFPISCREAHTLTFSPSELETFNAPTCVLFGKLDGVIRPTVHQETARTVADANSSPTKIRPVDDAGHLLEFSIGGQSAVNEVLDWMLQQT